MRSTMHVGGLATAEHRATTATFDRGRSRPIAETLCEAHSPLNATGRPATRGRLSQDRPPRLPHVGHPNVAPRTPADRRLSQRSAQIAVSGKLDAAYSQDLSVRGTSACSRSPARYKSKCTSSWISFLPEKISSPTLKSISGQVCSKSRKFHHFESASRFANH